MDNCARRKLISYNFDSGSSTGNILHAAAKQGSIEKVSEILNSGIISINSCDFTGKSALLLAASYGHLDLVRWLLSHGANIAEIDDFGQTAFQLAASRGYLEIMKWLYLNFKIDVNQKTSGSEYAFGENAVILASGEGHLEVVKWLILCVNANITERNNHGRNALDVAVKYKHDSVVSFLLRVGAGIKACLDVPFFDTFSFKDIFIMGATKNKRSVKDLNNDNFVDAITTPEILQRKIRKNTFCHIQIIRNTLIENLNRDPRDIELKKTMIILNSLVSLKLRCFFFMADTGIMDSKSFNCLTADLQEEYKQIKPANIMRPRGSFYCYLL